jgi:hypothetical protein
MTTATAPPAPVQQSIDLPEAMLQRVAVVRATRTALVADWADLMERRHAHFKTLHGDRKPGDPVPERTPLTDAAFDAYEGLVVAGSYAYLIAAMLREVDEADPVLAQRLAQMADVVREDGGECLEGANDDLDDEAADR